MNRAAHQVDDKCTQCRKHDWVTDDGLCESCIPAEDGDHCYRCNAKLPEGLMVGGFWEWPSCPCHRPTERMGF